MLPWWLSPHWIKYRIKLTDLYGRWVVWRRGYRWNEKTGFFEPRKRPKLVAIPEHWP